MAKSTSTSLWRPSNALAALGLLIMKGTAKLPMSWLQAIGKCLGTLAWWVFPYRKHVAETNIRLCYPEISEEELKKMLKSHYQAMGIGVFELAAAWYKDAEELLKVSEIIGLEHLEKVAFSGRGALLITGHFTTLEIIGRAILLRRKISCLYREPDQPVIAREMTRLRATEMQSVIQIEEVRELIRALRRGEMVWYTPDQARKIKYSEVLPFFGVPAVTNTATPKIIKTGKAALIPFVGYRLENGTYRIEFSPEMENMPTSDAIADATRINKVIEGLINKAPEQYFWLHKRFKRRGPGYEDVYARSSD